MIFLLRSTEIATLIVWCGGTIINAGYVVTFTLAMSFLSEYYQLLVLFLCVLISLTVLYSANSHAPSPTLLMTITSMRTFLYIYKQVPMFISCGVSVYVCSVCVVCSV